MPEFKARLGSKLTKQDGSLTKIESTVRYLGIEVDDAVAISEQVDV